MPVSARYWRLVSVQAYAGADLEIGGLHWYAGGVRADDSATLSSSHTPSAGALSALQDVSALTTARFSADAVNSSGFYLAWDFGVPVTDPVPRITAAGMAEFFGWGMLQYSSDARTWVTDLAFGRVIYPGSGQMTVADPKFRFEPVSAWDAQSKGATTLISGREAHVWRADSGFVRTGPPRSAGRRVFGLQASLINDPQKFFGGFSALAGWTNFTAGKHWLSYGHTGFFHFYPGGVHIPLTPEPGAPTSVGESMYFDVDLDTGYCAVKKGAGPWSAAVLLPNFVVGADYIISLFAPSTSSTAVAGAILKTTNEELAGVIPSGATAWDFASGTNPMYESTFSAPGAVPALPLATASTARDVEFGGDHQIAGTVKNEAGAIDTPVRRRVRLHHQVSGRIAREAWSDATTGAYLFDGIAYGIYYVTAFDHTGAFGGVIETDIIPEPMP